MVRSCTSTLFRNSCRKELERFWLFWNKVKQCQAASAAEIFEQEADAKEGERVCRTSRLLGFDGQVATQEQELDNDKPDKNSN